MRNAAVLRTVGRAPEARSPSLSWAVGGARLAPASRSQRRATGKVVLGEGLPGGRNRGAWGPGGPSTDQGGEEADGLGGLLGGEGDEVGLRQLDLLIHVISGRPSITSPVPGPGFRMNR